MKKKWIIANWKMNGSRNLATELAAAAKQSSRAGAEVVLCPPFTLLMHVEGLVRGSGIHVGGQNCHQEMQGAHTGDISAAMLLEAGCNYVILGHSERRQHHGENDALIKAKCEIAMASGLKTILCIGETEAERKKGKEREVVSRQLSACMPRQANSDNLLIAYEPVWAIGTGAVPSTAQIQEMHQHIRKEADGFTVLYGGSVKSSNAAEILGVPGVGGLLIGGASLEPESFAAIIGAAA